MTMDQDSSWDPLQLKSFLDLIQTHANDKQISFAPTHSNVVKSAVGEFIKKHESEKTGIINNPSKVMASGNVFKLSVWEEGCKFNEDLFIDEVDHEFCYKLRDKGYIICEFQDISMVHTLGNVKKTILPRPCKHSGVRLFYIFRNMLYIKKHFPNEYKNNGYKKYKLFAIIQKLLEFKFKDICFMLQGIKAYKKNIFGSYKNYLSHK